MTCSPASRWSELLEKRRAQGTWSSDPQKYIDELARNAGEGRDFTFTVEGPGGRAISIYNRPLPDGQWVSCHEDITERRKAEQQTHEQKRRLDAAIQKRARRILRRSADQYAESSAPNPCRLSFPT